MDAEPSEAQLDRRRLLAQAAAAGALVWVAPAVVSSPAAAQAGTTTCEIDGVDVVLLCEQPVSATVQWTVTGDCTDARVRIDVDGEPQEPCFQAADCFELEQPLFVPVTVTIRLLSNCEGEELDAQDVILPACFNPQPD